MSYLECQGTHVFPSGVSRGNVYAGQTPDSKGEAGWGCDVRWLLVLIIPGSNHATHAAGGSGKFLRGTVVVGCWLLKTQDTCLRSYDSQVSLVPQGTPMKLSQNMQFSLCAVRVATPFPGARGHLGWCGRSSHSASAGWVDSISEDTLLLDIHNKKMPSVYKSTTAGISVIALSLSLALSGKEPRTESRGLTSSPCFVPSLLCSLGHATLHMISPVTIQFPYCV